MKHIMFSLEAKDDDSNNELFYKPYGSPFDLLLEFGRDWSTHENESHQKMFNTFA